MKLAALYTVWNGLELLDQSIDQIYNEVDFIVICWQHTSNKGEYSNKVEPFVRRIEGRKVYLVEFKPDFAVNTKENERKKHNLMVEKAKKLGASHCFFSATDHFYKPKEFIKAKEYCKKNDFDVTFTAMYTYYKQVNWRLDPIEDYFMPFICKLHPHTRVENVNGYPVRVDPSIKLNTCNSWHLFEQSEIMLHHYSMIRIDIDNKFRNAAASIRWTPEQIERFKKEFKDAKLGDSISYFQGRILVETKKPNFFEGFCFN